MDIAGSVRSFLGRLHNQIVLPLVGATALVGIVSSIVGTVLISGIVQQWVEVSAASEAASLKAHVEAEKDALAVAANLLADDPRIADSSEDRDSLVQNALEASGADSVAVMDSRGRVLTAVGSLGFEPGDVAFPEDASRWGPQGREYVSFPLTAGQWTLTAFADGGASGVRVAVSKVVDADFLGGLGYVGSGFYCVTSPEAACVAAASTGSRPVPSSEDWLDLPEVQAALAAGSKASASVEIEGVPYSVYVEPIRFESDPTGKTLDLIAVVDSSVALDTAKATARLIVFWSVLAIAGLWALGLVVARRVTKPIVDLTESARYLAQGDYAHRVSAGGSNEVAQLTEAFNEMTDSLRERNESLTKKVLELATLYEMSRLLGSTLELEPLLDSVLDSATRIFDAEAGYVALRDKESGELKLAAYRGIEGSVPDESEIRSSIAEWVVREGRPLVFNPTKGGHEPVRADSITGSTSALCVPMVSSEGPIGALTVGSKDRSVRFGSDDVRLLSTVANHATIAIGNIELFSSLQEAYLATVRSLAAAVDAKDSFTRGHSDAVAVYAMALAEKLDLSTDQKRTLEMAAYLHDIGKIGVKESILLKPGKLDAEEMGQMRHHPLIGASILKPVVFPWPVAPIIRHHHEHWDGSGYPAGLKGEEIPLLARILTVADAYEAMTADRPYRKGRSKQDAVEELRRCAGTHFDPNLVEVFVEALEEIEPSAELESGRSEVQRDEVRAVFAAICDGMFVSFRRLGGPRLASNVEKALNESFQEARVPASYSGGRLFYRWDDSKQMEDEIAELRNVVLIISDKMAQFTGTTLVDHFYREALSELSGRLRRIALDLDLMPG